MNSAKASAATEGSILPQATMPTELAEDLPGMEGTDPASLSSHPALRRCLRDHPAAQRCGFYPGMKNQEDLIENSMQDNKVGQTSTGSESEGVVGDQTQDQRLDFKSFSGRQYGS